MRKLIILISALSVLLVYSVSFAEFDKSKLDKGVIGIEFKGTKQDTYKVLITKDKQKISYPLFSGQKDFFPLQYGNGEYQVAVMKKMSGNKYTFVEKTTVNLDLKDDKVIYLNSIQNVEWSDKDENIKFARKKSKGLSDEKTVFKTFYDYITENVSYDLEKAKKVTSEYVPVNSDVFKNQKGICYDYSSLFASFLRSNGIPTKLVKGYATDVEGYHAWNEVYIGGKWYIIDTTVDSTLKPNIKFKNHKDYKKINEY